MKIPRDIKGEQLVKVLTKFWGYEVIHQRGSHIILETNGHLEKLTKSVAI